MHPVPTQELGHVTSRGLSAWNLRLIYKVNDKPSTLGSNKFYSNEGKS
jgi:hypothetical protein